MEGDVVLSLQQTMTEPKAVEKESQKMEAEASEMDMLKLFKPDSLKCPLESSDLYEKLKAEPEALTVLAPDAGDTIISLDFNNSGAFWWMVTFFKWNRLSYLAYNIIS